MLYASADWNLRMGAWIPTHKTLKYYSIFNMLLPIGLFIVSVTFVANELVAQDTRHQFPVFKAHVLNTYGSDAAGLANQWQRVIEQLRDRETEEQLVEINRFFNQRIRWTDDRQLYKREDYWATPAETIGFKEGDCEDFTIIKYASLLELGVPADQLRLTYVRLRMPGGRSQAHMVLTWYAEPTAIPLVLDNVNPRVLPASQRNDLKPVFSFNNNQLWVGPTNSATTSNPSARLSQWRQVLNRAAAEGIYL
jgi:predicted transglutaminase-like cysteine proteinase